MANGDFEKEGVTNPTKWPEYVDGLLPFERLSKIRRVRRGGFGCVYRAKMEGYKRPVALKVLAVDDPSVTEMFVQEAVVLANLKHENIVKFIGLVNVPQHTKSIPESYTSPRLAFVEEFLEGGTIQRLVMEQLIYPGRRMYTLNFALDLLIDIAKAMQFLHEHQPVILHRDLTPDNIMVTRCDGKPCAKLIDFGLTMLINKEPCPMPRLGPRYLSKSFELLRSWLPFRNKQPNKDMEGHEHSRNGSRESLGDGTARDSAPILLELREENVKDAPETAVSNKKESNDGVKENQNNDDGGPNDRQGTERTVTNEDLPRFNLTGRTGSFMYMSPEVYDSRPYNAAADVFSFGTIMFETLSRSLLVVSETDMESSLETQDFARRIAEGYRPQVHGKVPAAVAELTDWCWKADPSARPDFRQVLKALHAIKKSGVLDEEPVKVRRKWWRCCFGG